MNTLSTSNTPYSYPPSFQQLPHTHFQATRISFIINHLPALQKTTGVPPESESQAKPLDPPRQRTAPPSSLTPHRSPATSPQSGSAGVPPAFFPSPTQNSNWGSEEIAARGNFRWEFSGYEKQKTKGGPQASTQIQIRSDASSSPPQPV